jgi:acyl-coenzyme A thioesterase PaaI-like protein
VSDEAAVPRPSFHDACRSVRVGDGVYERDLDERYWGHEAQFGGFAHALVLAAMRDELASAPGVGRDELASAPGVGRDELASAPFAPVSMSMHFIRPFLTGRFRCEVAVVRQGRNMANLRADVFSAGKLAGQAIATFARRREIGPFLAAEPPPELTAPVAPGEAPHDPNMGIPTHQHFDFWPRVGSPIERRADGNRVGGWVRMRDEPVLDELTLVMINDLWVPAAYHLWEVGHVAVSADITTQFRGVLPARVAPGESVFVQLRTAASAGGFVDEDTEVWTAAGELLCQGRQMRFIHG